MPFTARGLVFAGLLLLAGCRDLGDSARARSRIQTELGLDVRRVHMKESTVNGQRSAIYFVSLSKEVTPPERERITAIAQEVFEHRLTDVVFEVCSPSAECPDPPGY